MFGFGRKPLDEQIAIACAIRAACLLWVRLQDGPKLGDFGEHHQLVREFSNLAFRERGIKPGKEECAAVENTVVILVTEQGGRYVQSILHRLEKEGKEFRLNSNDITEVKKICEQAVNDYSKRV